LPQVGPNIFGSAGYDDPDPADTTYVGDVCSANRKIPAL
jgi:hypothetical protein